MRVSFATAACVVLLALLAGCSTSTPGTSAMPDAAGTSGANSSAGASKYPTNPFTGIHGKLTPDKIIKLQLDGKLPMMSSRQILEDQLKSYQAHQQYPHLRFNPNHTPAMWATNNNASYLVGLTKSGKYLSAVYTPSYGCFYPYTVKVDHPGNAWVSCEYNSSFNGGALAGFDQSGNSIGTRAWTFCGPSVVSCYGFGFDGAANNTHLYSSVEYFSQEICNPSCSYSGGDGYWWWPANNPSASGTFVNLSPYGMYDAYFMDVDASDNLYVDGYGCTFSSCGTGVAEVQNAASSLSFSWLVTPAQVSALGMECPQGVYVTGTDVLVITDNCSRELFAFSLPSGTFVGTLGPTRANKLGRGAPVSGGFNWNDTKGVQGDNYGWLDMGTVSTNQWKIKLNQTLTQTVYGAAYDPSDK